MVSSELVFGDKDQAVATTEELCQALQSSKLGLGAVRYVFDGFLGKGSCAVVARFRAQEQPSPFPSSLALKIMRPESVETRTQRERFLREVQLCSKLSHPHVARGISSGFYGNLPYLVSLFYEGGTLASHLKEKTFSLQDALRICHEILDGLEYLYAQGIHAHRDLKPANILLDARGHATIADLGIARSMLHAEHDIDTAFLGTLCYMAPEQIDDASRADMRSDFYSLTCILHEMLSGKRAFSGKSRREILADQLSGRVPELPVELKNDLSAESHQKLTKIMNCGFSVDLIQRPQTTTEYRQMIVELEESIKAEAPEEHPTFRARDGPLKRLLVIAVTGIELIVISLVCLGLVLCVFAFMER